MDALRSTSHRPFPLPRGPWVMAQTWHDLLFAHRRVPLAALRAHVPDGLTLDTFDGDAWLGVVPFRMSSIRGRFLPPFPRVSAFVELNVRTYVVHDGVPGVWFFSLDATEPIAVSVARRWFHLPYFDARMSCRAAGEAVTYASERTDARGPTARLAGTYAPTGPVALACAGSLEAWLTERYVLYAADARGRIVRGDIHHAPWPLQPARARFDVLAMASAFGWPDGAEPEHLAFARRLDVAIWAPRVVSAGPGAGKARA